MTRLYVLDQPATTVSELARSDVPAPTVVYWAGGSADPAALRQLSDRADQMVVEDSIVDAVGEHSRRDPIPLSVFDKSAGWRYRPGQDRADAGESRGPVMFFASNDTIAKMFLPVHRRLKDACFVTPSGEDEGATTFLSTAAVDCVKNHPRLLEDLRPSVVAFGNDWSSEEIELIGKARKKRIPTVCLQEGSLDWGDSFRRMEWADFPFVQGPLTPQYLRRDSYFLTGNPRFDALRNQPLPVSQTVMINCNFTYGVHEDIRSQWVGDVVAACRNLGVDFFVSQHPRDPARLTGLPVRPSRAAVVHEHVADSSLLITRFSTLVYEAMLMGRPVLYYNPHRERMTTFNQDATGGLHRVNDSAGLPKTIRAALDGIHQDKPLREALLALHCGAHDGAAASRCASALLVVAQAGVLSDDGARQRRSFLRSAKRHLRRMAHAILGSHSHS